MASLPLSFIPDTPSLRAPFDDRRNARRRTPAHGTILTISMQDRGHRPEGRTDGLVVHLRPITGVPLPLISYSGSFALMIMFALGVVNSVWVHRHDVA
ncbi:MAG TPA: FtsW/RodA/SpoVE family cell cycle protein [Reyranella sp.]|nr:FtsW/RodA/SpoVE family cell cycle protein [Reyranella sp.]